MNMEIIYGILIPFIGTSLGSACVFFMKNKLNDLVERALIGFAAGVMIAASVWSLLIPAMNQSVNLDKWAFIPVIVGFWVGILFLLIMDKTIPHFHLNSTNSEGIKSHLKKTTMMILAVALHNLPEGMAVGISYAGYQSSEVNITLTNAFILAIGIAIQNIPEGAIISMPLRSEGLSKRKSFLYGILSGLVEPLGAMFTLIFASKIISLLPFFLSFAAGAMIYVVVEELIPEMSQGTHSNIGTIFFALGFSIMMILDMILG